MQSRPIAEVLNASDGGLAEKENIHHHVQNDSGSALQQFLDHIPISSLAGIKDSLGTCFFLVIVGNFVLHKINTIYPHEDTHDSMHALFLVPSYVKFWN